MTRKQNREDHWSILGLEKMKIAVGDGGDHWSILGTERREQWVGDGREGITLTKQRVGGREKRGTLAYRSLTRERGRERQSSKRSRAREWGEVGKLERVTAQGGVCELSARFGENKKGGKIKSSSLSPFKLIRQRK